MSEHRDCGKCHSGGLECFLCGFCPFESLVLLEEFGKGAGNPAEIFNKSTVKVHQAWEDLNVMD